MSKTLLLADDSLTIQRVVDLTFAQEDVRVVSCGTGDLAVKWMEDELPDIVLADVGMPQPDGYAVAHHMKQSARLRDVPVLLLTGAFEPLDDDKARESECDGVLVKPFEPQHLVARVVELLARLPKERPAPPAEAVPAPVPEGELPDVSQAFETEEAAPPAPVSLHLVEPPAAPPAIEPFDLEAFSADMDALDTAADLHSPESVLEPIELLESIDPLEPLAPLTPLAPMATEAWDLAAPSELVPAEPEAMPPEPTPPPAMPPPASPAPAMPPVSLASAFAALLAAEQAHPMDARPAGSSSVMTEAAIEDVVRRVLLRVTDEMVRQVVLDAAERLVKAEIDKIKDSAEEQD